MYGDTAVIRGLARRLREVGVDLRAEARALNARIDATAWTGRTAEVMRAIAERRLEALHQTACRHDDAAAALERHADQVDELKELIATIEGRVGHLVAAARERLSGVAGGVLSGLGPLISDPGDEFLDHFIGPPPGHLDWLQVELPGLGR